MCAPSVRRGAFRCDETLLSPPQNAGEEWGRQERYAFFARLAQAHGAKVATARACSDNAETVLFNLARGSAARGAAGIPPVRGPYVRPLLWAPRADASLAYLARCGVPHVTDATDDTDAYARNRIRHGVLPALERAHPGAARSVTRFAAEMSAVADSAGGTGWSAAGTGVRAPSCVFAGKYPGRLLCADVGCGARGRAAYGAGPAHRGRSAAAGDEPSSRGGRAFGKRRGCGAAL